MAKTSTKQTSVHAELLKWFLFSVCMGLAPLLLRWALPSLSASFLPFREVLKDGELFLVGIGLAGAALSDLFAARKDDTIGQIALFGGIACILVSSAAYGILFAGGASSIDHVIIWSAIAFVASVIVGAAGILFKEVSE